MLLDTAQRPKWHAERMAGRPFEYLNDAGVWMEQRARQLAERDGIEQGLVCVFSNLEPCRAFAFNYGKGDAYVQSGTRKCLHLYYCFMERQFGLARKLTAANVLYTQSDNVFVGIQDVAAGAALPGPAETSSTSTCDNPSRFPH